MPITRTIKIDIPSTISASQSREILMAIRQLSTKHSLHLSTTTIVEAEKPANKMVDKLDVKLLEKK